MVTKDEANRYLQDSLLWHYWMFDGVAIYDDQSTDATVSIANEYGAKVRVRPETSSSFLEHEGQFREDAWRWLSETFHPTNNDWVLSLDADEFYTGTAIELYEAARNALAFDHASVSLDIPEVFDFDDDGTPLIRTDGYWAGLRAPRFCRWLPNGNYHDKKMASGSTPIYSEHNPYISDLSILHYGYARPEDRQVKFDRYKSLPGHNPSHIRSILTAPTLRRWESKIPILR